MSERLQIGFADEHGHGNGFALAGGGLLLSIAGRLSRITDAHVTERPDGGCLVAHIADEANRCFRLL